MEVAAVVSVCQGLYFVLGWLLEFYVTINSFLCHINHLSCCCVYMCMSIYDSATDAIALNEKNPHYEGFGYDVRMYASLAS